MAETVGPSAERVEHCSECGNSIEPMARFCMYCGNTAAGTITGRVGRRRLFPVLGGLLIIAGGLFSFVTAWFVNESRSGYGSHIIMSTGHFTLAFAIIIGFLGFISVVGGAVAVLRMDYSLAFLGGVASCFSIGAPVGLAGLLMLAVSRDEFVSVKSTQEAAFSGAPNVRSAQDEVMIGRRG